MRVTVRQRRCSAWGKLAIQSPRRNCGVRLPSRSWTRWGDRSDQNQAQTVVPEGSARGGSCCRLSCLIVSIDSGKSLTHCECSSHSFIASRFGTHRPTEDQTTVRGDADPGAGRASAADGSYLGPRVSAVQGILQTDGYAVQARTIAFAPAKVFLRPHHTSRSAWSHARRQFFEAVQLNPRDPVATPIVARMDELFAVDAEARRKTLTTAARHVRRQETARPLLDDIRSKIEAAQSAALPSNALSKACQYALALWKKLTRFLEYPELELSTNLAENCMRPVALGRKNWLHIGSPQAGPKVAAILSVVESCRRLQVPVRDYFSTILPGLADLPIRCLPDLTPAVWAARQT